VVVSATTELFDVWELHAAMILAAAIINDAFIPLFIS